MQVIRSKPFIHYDPTIEDGSNDPRSETMEKPNDFLSQIPSVADVKERIRRHGEERKILRKLLNLAEEAERVRGGDNMEPDGAE